jgi:protein SCO1/2
MRAVRFSYGKWAAIAASVFLIEAAAAAQGMYGGSATGARPATPPPSILQNVTVEQKLNQQVPLDLPFKDEYGKDVKLGDYFGQKPVVLALVYYQCPMLCTEVMSGMASAFSVLKFDIGKEYKVLNVSFDPRETPAMAAAKKQFYLRRYGRPGAEQGWHFLTGPADSINALTKAVGFHYQWDPKTEQFAHATAIMVLSPQGKIAQYYYGVEYSPRDLRLGLVQASQNQVGNIVDQVLLYCYHYDPRTGKYGAVITRVLRVAGVFTIVLLGGMILLMLKLDPRQKGRSRGDAERRDR